MGPELQDAYKDEDQRRRNDTVYISWATRRHDLRRVQTHLLRLPLPRLHLGLCFAAEMGEVGLTAAKSRSGS
jgi:hypothetical protein